VHSVTDRQTDRQTDDIMMPTADQSYDRMKQESRVVAKDTSARYDHRPRHALAEWFTLAPRSWTYSVKPCPHCRRKVRLSPSLF